jgi:hypothetical protein
MAKPFVNLVNKYIYESVIFFLLCFEAAKILIVPSKIAANYFTIQYLYSYSEFGFVNRSLIGSLMSIVNGEGNFVSQNFLWFFILFFLILICLLTAFLLGKFIKTIPENLKFFAVALTVLFLAGPVSPAYLFDAAIAPDVDIYGDISSIYPLLLALIGVILLKLPPKVAFLSFLIPILCVLMISVHQVAIISYIPILVLLTFYEVYINKTRKPVILILTILFSLIAVIYFGAVARLLFQHMFPLSIEGFIEKLPQTNFINGNVTSAYEMNNDSFKSIVYHVQGYWKEALFPELFLKLFCTFVLTLPMTAYMVSFWKKLITSEGDKYKKWFFLFCASTVWAVLMFVFLGDWGRWIAFALISNFFFMFYFLYSKESSALEAAKLLQTSMKNRPLIFVAVIIYLMLLGRINIWMGFPVEFNLKAILLDLIR